MGPSRHRRSCCDECFLWFLTRSAFASHDDWHFGETLRKSQVAPAPSYARMAFAGPKSRNRSASVIAETEIISSAGPLMSVGRARRVVPDQLRSISKSTRPGTSQTANGSTSASAAGQIVNDRSRCLSYQAGLQLPRRLNTA